MQRAPARRRRRPGCGAARGCRRPPSRSCPLPPRRCTSARNRLASSLPPIGPNVSALSPSASACPRTPAATTSSELIVVEPPVSTTSTSQPYDAAAPSRAVTTRADSSVCTSASSARVSAVSSAHDGMMLTPSPARKRADVDPGVGRRPPRLPEHGQRAGGRGGERVAAVLGSSGGVRGDPGEVRAQLGGRERTDRSPDDVAERQVETEVQRHEPVDAVERTGVQHRAGPATALLGGLEQEAHRAGEVRVLLQPLGQGEPDRDVAVVAAGVHAVLEGGAESFLLRDVRRLLARLLDRERVGVEAQRPRRSGARCPRCRRPRQPRRGVRPRPTCRRRRCRRLVRPTRRAPHRSGSRRCPAPAARRRRSAARHPAT